VLVALLGGSPLLAIPALAGLALAALALRRRQDAFAAAQEAAWLLVPLAVAVAVSTVKPLLVARYLLVALPGVLLLAARAVLALPRPRWSAGAALLLVAAGLLGTAFERWTEPPWQPVDRAAAQVASVARPGDALVVSHPAMDLALQRELARRPAPPDLALIAPAPGDPLGLDPRGLAPLPGRLAGHRGAIFVLWAERADAAQERLALEARWRTTSDVSFEGLRVLRLEAPAP